MMTQKVKSLVILFMFLAVIPATGCTAGNDNRRQQGPPPEAIAACKDKAVGDTVQFSGRRGETIEATCQEIEGQIVAVPEGMEGGRPPRD
ncbi:hypothetical protein [Desulfogranum marinum]|jgi:hypothetical protein|uniref:hypothetical protein n=1 Tax=Desulfogranum marinum TaxID=453220 RepID=UPI0029C77785|nr:hypothetical protein [Desulfogranum marinum]